MATTTGTTPHRGDLDGPNLTAVSPADDARTILINDVSWGGVLAGVVAGLVTQLILNLIGVGIGASTLNPMTSDNPTASGFSIGAGIWWALSGIVAAFVGGYVASRLSGRPKASTGSWHGLTSWALTTLVIFYLLTTAVGGLIGGAFNACRALGTCQGFVVADHLVDHERQELFRKIGIEPGFVRQLAQPCHLLRFAGGVGGRHAVGGLEPTHRLGAAEALGQHVHQGGVDVVDAAAQFLQAVRSACVARIRVHRHLPFLAPSIPARLGDRLQGAASTARVIRRRRRREGRSRPGGHLCRRRCR